LKKIKEIDPDAVVIFITAYSDTEKAVQAIKAGATDFIPKPWAKDKLLATVASAVQLRRSRTEVSRLKKQVAALQSHQSFPEIIGESVPMLALFETIDKLKDTDANILILGEKRHGERSGRPTCCITPPRGPINLSCTSTWEPSPNHCSKVNFTGMKRGRLPMPKKRRAVGSEESRREVRFS